jgi:hypothetical protein
MTKNSRMKKQNKLVINLRGEQEPFSFKKVYQSVKRAGSPDFLAKTIAKDIERGIRPGIKTSEIFKKIKTLLAKKEPKAAIRFSLKKAIQKLGPTGFPFEKYVAAIFKNSGFDIKINQYLQGFCLKYEIDFWAQKESLFYVGECKYRNLLQEGVIHSNIALANFARFMDIKDGNFVKQEKFKNCEIKTILVTNAKFSLDTIKFSLCRNVDLLGWRCPKDRGLEYFIETKNLYPITILPSLNKTLVDIFVSENIMLVKDLLKLDIVKFSKEMKIPLNCLENLIKEAKIVLEE